MLLRTCLWSHEKSLLRLKERTSSARSKRNLIFLSGLTSSSGQTSLASVGNRNFVTSQVWLNKGFVRRGLNSKAVDGRPLFTSIQKIKIWQDSQNLCSSGPPKNVPDAIIETASLFEGDDGDAEISPSPKKMSRQRTLDEVIYRIQAEVRRKRRVHKAEIHNAVDLIAEASKVGDFGAFLLDCCCDILPDLELNYRIKLAKRIWAVVQESKEYSAANFEAMLKALAMNEDKSSSPFSYLEEAKSAGVGITSTMYYFALLILCQRGDIDAAVDLLGMMKENGVPVNERFFNVLILGHARKGDLESAKEIIDLMRASYIEPSSHTWTVLLQAYIEAGELELMKTTYAKEVGTRLSEEQFYDLIKAAGRQSNPKIFHQVIDWAFSSKKMLYLSVKCVALQLMYFGMVHNSLKTVLKFSEILQSEQEHLGAFFIKDLHFNVTDPDTYVELVLPLQDEKRNPYALNQAAESCLKHKKFDFVYKIYEAMSVLDLPLRPHYFYPPFINETANDGVNGSVKVLKVMKTLNVSPDWEMLVNWVIPDLCDKRDLFEALNIIRDAADISFSSGLLNAGLVVALRERRFKDCVSTIQRIKGKLTHPDVLAQALLKFVTESLRDISSSPVSTSDILLNVPKLLKHISDNVPPDESRDLVGWILLKLSESDELRKETETLLEAVIKLNVPLSESTVEALKDRLGFEEGVEGNKRLARYNGNGRVIAKPSEMDASALESHLEELEAKDLNKRGASRKLFLKYCQAGDMAKALEMKSTFESEYGELSFGMKSALLGVFIRNDALQPALDLFHDLKDKTDDADEDIAEIDTYKIIDLATLMAKKGMLKAAVELIRNECPRRTENRPESFSRNIVRFLEALSFEVMNQGNGTPKVEEENLVQNMTNFFMGLGMIKPINPTLGPYIKDFIRREKLLEAVESLESFSTKYHIAPAIQELTYKVMDKPDLLARVLKCSASVKGVREAKRLFAIAKSDLGDTDGAAMVFLELGDQLSFISIIRHCEYLVSRKQYDKLLNLIDSLYKTGRRYNCKGLYTLAIKGCERTGDVDTLRKIVSSMQEHDVFIPPDVKKLLKTKDCIR